jgi:hypothetical protein
MAAAVALSYARAHAQPGSTRRLEVDMQRSDTARWIDGAAQLLIGATAVVAACIALTGTGLRPHGEMPAGRFRMAMAAYEAQQWPQAYAQLSAAADAGDPSAARVAAMMARQGPLLFGQRFDVSPERLARWERAMSGEAPTVPKSAVVDVQVAGAR